MSRFRDIKSLQKFASAHASIHNHFNLERHLTPRETFKQNRSAWSDSISFPALSNYFSVQWIKLPVPLSRDFAKL